MSTKSLTRAVEGLVVAISTRMEEYKWSQLRRNNSLHTLKKEETTTLLFRIQVLSINHHLTTTLRGHQLGTLVTQNQEAQTTRRTKSMRPRVSLTTWKKTSTPKSTRKVPTLISLNIKTILLPTSLYLTKKRIWGTEKGFTPPQGW